MNRKLPYVAFLAFERFLNDCSRRGLPRQLDALSLNLPPSSARQLMACLKALDLLDADACATPELQLLIGSWGSDRYPDHLQHLLDRCYPTLGQFDLASETLDRLMRDPAFAKVQGDTRIRAVRFFLGAADASGRTIGPRLLERPRRAPRGATTRRRNRRHELADVLMSKFPDFDPGWEPSLQMAWLTNLRLMTEAIMK